MDQWSREIKAAAEAYADAEIAAGRYTGQRLNLVSGYIVAAAKDRQQPGSGNLAAFKSNQAGRAAAALEEAAGSARGWAERQNAQEARAAR